MVYKDYELVNNTRTRELRSAWPAYQRRLFIAQGGLTYYLLSAGTFGYSFYFLCNKFEDFPKVSKGAQPFVKFGVAFIISLKLANLAATWTTLNMGDVEDLQYLSTNREIKKIAMDNHIAFGRNTSFRNFQDISEFVNRLKYDSSARI
jgi:hypothetical protein